MRSRSVVRVIAIAAFTACAGGIAMLPAAVRQHRAIQASGERLCSMYPFAIASIVLFGIGVGAAIGLSVGLIWLWKCDER